MFLAEAGLPNPKIREIIARSIDYYTEYLEELCSIHSFNPKSKEIRDELYQVSQLKAERSSVWGSLDLPKIDLASFGAFPKYSQLARQYIRPVNIKLPRVRKPKTTGKTFAEIAARRTTIDLPDVTPEAEPIELTGDPESGKLLFNKFENH